MDPIAALLGAIVEAVVEILVWVFVEVIWAGVVSVWEFLRAIWNTAFRQRRSDPARRDEADGR